MSGVLIILLKLIARLPLSVLYLISDVLFFWVYLIFGYRKRVVLTNLRNSFPEKSEAEIQQISRKFYRHLCDLIVETLKIPGLSKKELEKRCTYTTPEHVHNFYQKKQSFVAVLGHLGNWEWTSLMVNLQAKQTLYALYSPLKNKAINKYILETRAQWGTKLIPMKNAFRVISENLNKTSITAFITDQAASPKHCHWMTFLNQDTPVFLGAAKIAIKYNLPVVLGTVRKTKRGHYEITSEVITETPGDYSEEQLTEVYTKRLEQAIIEQPEIWLWSHRRWKHKKPGNKTG